jgi:hypothetical protein
MPVSCPFCGREFSGDKLNSRHLSKCRPESHLKVRPCLCGHVSTSLTQMKRHQQSCETWKKRDRGVVQTARQRATSLERYGVEDAAHLPEVQARREATNLERYGAANPLCREASTFDKVQESLIGKRVGLHGEDNPFAWAETQEKIREHWQQEHGVDNPQQVPEIRERTLKTNLERYGFEQILSSPEMRERIKTTCEQQYGGPAPSCSPKVLKKAQTTNLAKYGVPWTAMDPEVRRKQLDAMKEHYGSHYFASDLGKTEIRAALLKEYGVEFPAQIEGNWEKRLATFRQNYPGVAFPHMLPRLCPGPNKLEQKVWDMAPQLQYTGDGSFWRWLPALGHHKNPDFILPGLFPGHPFREVLKIVEVFGNFWHSQLMTGIAPFDHEQELVTAFAKIGISCFVIWESEVNDNPKKVAERLATFLSLR